MKLLLDTNVFLHYLSADPRLPPVYKEVIRDPENLVFLSVASIWEAVIKHSLGKLPLPSPPAEYLPTQREAHRITSLPIDEAVLLFLARLPPLHRDPFDRIIVAQALRHDLVLVTLDQAVRVYPAEVLPQS